MTKKITAPVEEKDFILSSLISALDFLKQNKKGVLTALGILVLAAVIGYAYSTHVKNVTEKSWAAYYTAQVQVLGGNQEEGFKQIDALNADFPGSDAAEYAQLFKGDMLYASENFAQAADVYKPLTGSTNETVYTVASLSLASSLQAAKDYKASAEEMTKFIQQNPKSFALPQAYFTLALSQELAGNKNEALEAYKHLVENYAKTYFGSVAKDKIKELQK
ncbi:tetratricopeptide repeat protein [Candidatus Avelusimicrobium stercoris]|uniref:tetratricopeptide repeat protein n=1 Tax=Candidatus Avelusimicrobium stercoris TaxID=1947924 RepID=UPI003D0AD613